MTVTRNEMGSSWRVLIWRWMHSVHNVISPVPMGPSIIVFICRGCWSEKVGSWSLWMVSWSIKLPATPELIKAVKMKTDPECLVWTFNVRDWREMNWDGLTKGLLAEADVLPALTFSMEPRPAWDTVRHGWDSRNKKISPFSFSLVQQDLTCHGQCAWARGYLSYLKFGRWVEHLQSRFSKQMAKSVRKLRVICLSQHASSVSTSAFRPW